MSYSIGIFGLANAGKSTIFSALTAISVACESYPFCTRALFASGLNRSLVHVDLPLDAEVTFS